MGPDHLPVERISHPNSRRDDPLRNDENGSTGDIAGAGRDNGGDGRYGQFDPTGTNGIGGRGEFRRTVSAGSEYRSHIDRERIFSDDEADITATAVCNSARGGSISDVRGKPAVGGNQWRRASGG